jgi:cell division protein FtsW
MMKRPNPTFVIFLITLILVGLGLVMVYSSSAPKAAHEIRKAMRHKDQEAAEQLQLYHYGGYLYRQFFWLILGFISLLIFYHFDFERLADYSYYLLIASFGLLVLVFAPGVGQKINGAWRWIRLGPFSFQPSEFAKLALILAFARYLSENRGLRLRQFAGGFLPMLLCVGLMMGLIIIEPDYGTTALVGLIAGVMWIVGGVRVRHWLSVSVVGVVGFAIAVVLDPERLKRVLVVLYPDSDYYGAGYQLTQSLISIGSGGLFGKGLGEGLQKYLFLTESHTDFIFSILGEELGFAGASFVVLLFLIFVLMGIKVALKAPDYYGGLVATGITAMIGFSAFINFAVVLGIAPTKGLALPLISYGGSSLLVNLTAIGILLNISKYKEFAFSGNRVVET